MKCSNLACDEEIEPITLSGTRRLYCNAYCRMIWKNAMIKAKNYLEKKVRPARMKDDNKRKCYEKALQTLKEHANN